MTGGALQCLVCHIVRIGEVVTLGEDAELNVFFIGSLHVLVGC